MKKPLVSPNPHIHAKVSTASLMGDVLIALAPATLASILFYGWKELLIVAVGIASCVLVEWAITKWLMKKEGPFCGSAATVTGLLLALSLPPATPWWVVFIGSVFAIGVVKMTFGGLGQNVFNPAVAGRVFLLISFPAIMTDWTPTPGFLHATDAISGATLLGLYCEGGVGAVGGVDYLQTLFYNIGGSAGEISALAMILGFVYLLARRVIKPWTTLSILGTVALFSLVFWLINPAVYTGPVFNLITGGLLMGAVFMATDYVTSPMSNLGCVVFGAGIGLLTMIIRYWGAYPEGVSFAILIMNAFVPLINKGFHNKKYGRA